MLTENTVTKLQEMHLSAMAKAFKDQLTDPNMAGMSFEDRFGLLVDHEWTTRKNNHLNRLIKSAGFAEPNACVEDIEYHADRNLDKTQIARLASCDYIIDHRNVMLLGATGSEDLSGLRAWYGSSEEISYCQIRTFTGTSHRTGDCTQ